MNAMSPLAKFLLQAGQGVEKHPALAGLALGGVGAGAAYGGYHADDIAANLTEKHIMHEIDRGIHDTKKFATKHPMIAYGSLLGAGGIGASAAHDPHGLIAHILGASPAAKSALDAYRERRERQMA